MEEKLHGSSADIIVYTCNNGILEVLTGVRKHDPWKSCITVPFGGHVKASDSNVISTACREVFEETGLIVRPRFFVGIYGPERYHYSFDGRHALRLEQDRSSVNHVFAGHITGGALLKESGEQGELKLIRPIELAGKQMCFDHALALADFLDAWECGSVLSWRHEALKLIK
ncbi:MAG: NUDIX domain-containing protein [Patescibacteria group bacterium]